MLAKAGTDIDSSKGHMLLEQHLGAQAILLCHSHDNGSFTCGEVLPRIGTGVLNYAIVYTFSKHIPSLWKESEAGQ